MSDIQINQVLQQMRAMAAAAESRPNTPTAAGEAPPVDFAQLLKDSLDTVNEAQGTASEMARSFELGEKGVDLAEVMVAAQKASLSFEAMKQVRNQLLNAYRDIMNMSV